jgi:hypothetical protein
MWVRKLGIMDALSRFGCHRRRSVDLCWRLWVDERIREMLLFVRKGLWVSGCTRNPGTSCRITVIVDVCILHTLWRPNDEYAIVLQLFTGNLGSGIRVDIGLMDTYLGTRNLGSDIGMIRRVVWVRMLQETFGGCMFTKMKLCCMRVVSAFRYFIRLWVN